MQSTECQILLHGKPDPHTSNKLSPLHIRYNVHDFIDDLTVSRLKLQNSVQVSVILAFIFTLSIQLHWVPCLWKDSNIVTVPINKVPKSLNHKPGAPFSLFMISLEEKHTTI